MPEKMSTMHIRPLTSLLFERYQRDGFLLLPPDFLSSGVLQDAIALMPEILRSDDPSRVLERDNATVRSVYGLHRTYPQVHAITRHPLLLGAVEQLVGGGVYVHQSKINFKAPFSGDQWEWHQDFVYWLQNDGIPKPDLVNASIFLDEVTEFNGPLTFIPGSHRRGVLSGKLADGMPAGYEDAPAWVSTLTAEEKFNVDTSVIDDLARTNGLVSPKGPAGSVLLFHPNLLHASAPNLSPFRRTVLILVYNSVANTSGGVANPRPPFLADPDVRALRPLVPTATEGMPR
ncbi:phytanoyl-CoA dioxygenase [Actinomadura sp. NEAU-AAG5]|uniref:Phytanoyl-CoA dioxygenase n=2 Tax=Actinomadura litoris TaxID=2678616 RepID=A0A7K1KXH2_9ACTN|nr:phytanoyl-CoA dioxygenase [Actinomadura litoris]